MSPTLIGELIFLALILLVLVAITLTVTARAKRLSIGQAFRFVFLRSQHTFDIAQGIVVAIAILAFVVLMIINNR